MKLQIISFGKISEIFAPQEMEIENISGTEDLKAYLENLFPKLKGMKYKLAVNQNIIQANQALLNNDMVAIMPPFSGG